MRVLLADTLLEELSITFKLLTDVKVVLGGRGVLDSATLLIEEIGAGGMSVSVGRTTLLVGTTDVAGAVDDVVETPGMGRVAVKFMVEAAFASGVAVGGKP